MPLTRRARKKRLEETGKNLTGEYRHKSKSNIPHIDSHENTENYFEHPSLKLPQDGPMHLSLLFV